jgi:crotonobetainyl-CoA:carnitine CoA-transferase CaiB-like acyl-CoA transferase
VANREALRPLLVTELARADNAQWLEGLLAAGVPCGPINDNAGAAAHPQVQSREFFVEVDGRKFARAPLGLSRTPVTVRRGPAAIGQHTFEVLTDAGFEPARIRDLAASGAVLLGAES